MIKPETLMHCLKHGMGEVIKVQLADAEVLLTGPVLDGWLITKANRGLLAVNLDTKEAVDLPPPPKHPQTGIPLMSDESTSYGMYIISKVSKLNKERNAEELD